MNVYRHVTPLIVILLLTVLFVGVVTIHSTIDTAAPVSVEGAALKYKGINYISPWWTTPPGNFSSSGAQASLNALKSTGANWVGVNVYWEQSSHTSNTIYSDPTYTQTDAAVIDAINDIHTRGMSVMLKPMLHWEGGNATVAPTDPAAWFASYATFVNHYARIARDHGVELFCIGCELNLIDRSYYSNWSTVISGVRAIYSGPLTYAANWWDSSYSKVPFWGLLDYAGIDAYFPLSDAQTPSVADLVGGWSHYAYGDGTHNWTQEIEMWQATVKKPVIFTEIGYRSVDYAAQNPANSQPGGAYNANAQANCYGAVWQVFANKPWFAGMFWWAWYPDPKAGGAGNTDFMPQNKPAQSVLTADWLGTP